MISDHNDADFEEKVKQVSKSASSSAFIHSTQIVLTSLFPNPGVLAIIDLTCTFAVSFSSAIASETLNSANFKRSTCQI